MSYSSAIHADITVLQITHMEEKEGPLLGALQVQRLCEGIRGEPLWEGTEKIACRRAVGWLKV